MFIFKLIQMLIIAYLVYLVIAYLFVFLITGRDTYTETKEHFVNDSSIYYTIGFALIPISMVLMGLLAITGIFTGYFK